MKFNITIEVDEDGRYVAECTDLPGCLSEGENFKEAIENICEAIVGCLKSRLKVAGEQLKIYSFVNTCAQGQNARYRSFEETYRQSRSHK